MDHYFLKIILLEWLPLEFPRLYLHVSLKISVLAPDTQKQSMLQYKSREHIKEELAVGSSDRCKVLHAHWHMLSIKNCLRNI